MEGEGTSSAAGGPALGATSVAGAVVLDVGEEAFEVATFVSAGSLGGTGVEVEAMGAVAVAVSFAEVVPESALVITCPVVGIAATAATGAAGGVVDAAGAVGAIALVAWFPDVADRAPGRATKVARG